MALLWSRVINQRCVDLCIGFLVMWPKHQKYSSKCCGWRCLPGSCNCPIAALPTLTKCALSAGYSALPKGNPINVPTGGNLHPSKQMVRFSAVMIDL